MSVRDSVTVVIVAAPLKLPPLLFKPAPAEGPFNLNPHVAGPVGFVVNHDNPTPRKANNSSGTFIPRLLPRFRIMFIVNIVFKDQLAQGDHTVTKKYSYNVITGNIGENSSILKRGEEM